MKIVVPEGVGFEKCSRMWNFKVRSAEGAHKPFIQAKYQERRTTEFTIQSNKNKK